MDFKNMLSKMPFKGGTGMAPKSFMDSGTLNTGPLRTTAADMKAKVGGMMNDARTKIQSTMNQAKAGMGSASSASSSSSHSAAGGRPAGMTGQAFGQARKASNMVRKNLRKGVM